MKFRKLAWLMPIALVAGCAVTASDPFVVSFNEASVEVQTNWLGFGALPPETAAAALRARRRLAEETCKRGPKRIAEPASTQHLERIVSYG